MKIVVTGCSGFIGFHLCFKLTHNKKNFIYGIDNMNNYYDTNLKKDRLKILKQKKNFSFNKININNYSKLKKFFNDIKVDVIINLAAQAGVRYSIYNSKSYLDANINGFYNILEISKNLKIKHLIYASSSSVYGDKNKFPIKEKDNTNNPLSFYAASKKMNEIMAYSYSNIHNLPTSGLRFFTVYGPYGRPDMSLYKFVDGISKNKKINVFNYGNHERDFTYVDDVVEIIEKLITKKPAGKVPYKIFNISSGKPKKLKTYIRIIEKILGKKSKKNYLNMQLGDVKKTHGESKLVKKLVNKKNFTKFEIGIEKYIKWYKDYYLNE